MKIFCIGQNKTGTTSLKKAFEELNFIVGNQRKAEILYDNLLSTNHFNEIIKVMGSKRLQGLLYL